MRCCFGHMGRIDFIQSAKTVNNRLVLYAHDFILRSLLIIP